MIIGFDAKRIVRNGTGLGSYGRTLVNDLSALGDLSLRLYAPDQGRDDLRSQIAMRENVTFCYPTPSRLPMAKARWRSSGIVSDLRRDGVQLYHGLSGELPRGIRKSGIKSVVTIHDLIFMRHPEYYHRADVWLYTWKFRQALKEADHIVAISERTKQDIMELGRSLPLQMRGEKSPIPLPPISVIYQSFAPRFSVVERREGSGEIKAVRTRYNLPRRFILNVGTIEARKNVLLAIKALEQLPEEIALVVVGRKTSYAQRVTKYVNRHGLSHRVTMLHGVPDDDLPAIYAMAETFVYPSRYEGFGIPIIEAIGCGLPVVACTGSCLEEAGGPDSLYVGPDDVKAMAVAIRQTLRGAKGREERIDRSQQYITRFANDNTAQQYAELYRELLTTRNLPF